ncbi:MAG: rod shape-determining protein MreD [Polaribacter sp.]|nr:MAG: rod shape-determining protein MreD [Polaribacter sp.]
MNKNLRLISLFLFLLLLQVLILNNINLFGYINPYLYIAFIFAFPVNKNKVPILTFSFLLGLFVDIFSNSGGINAIALLSIAYLREGLFKRIFQKTESEYKLFNLDNEPFGDVFIYISILTFTHHFILFSLANFSVNHFFKNVILNTLVSGVFTLLLYFLGSFIFRKSEQNEA